MYSRNLLILMACQLISVTGSLVMITLGGIIGTALADDPAFATLPISVMVISIAITAIPATILMKRVGRKAGFAAATLTAVVAMVLAAWSLQQHSFVWFVIAAGLLGVNLAFTQQYRFAAAESVQPANIGRAISMVLVGAIGGAMVGPVLVIRGQHWIADAPYAGTLLAAAAFYVVQFGLLTMLGPFRVETETEEAAEPRTLLTIVRQPAFLVAVLGGAVAYGVMSLIMTATPLSMHVIDKFSIAETASVIRGHVLGMYMPSLISGYLLVRFGVAKVMASGAVALLLAVAVALLDRSYIHYWIVLITLGVGWNFLYVGGTTLLTMTYVTSERFKAQAVNEFSVFGSAAVASLMAGTVIHLYGWGTLILLPLPLLLLIFLALYGVRTDVRVRESAGRAAIGSETIAADARYKEII
jgi:MFS family permease